MKQALDWVPKTPEPVVDFTTITAEKRIESTLKSSCRVKIKALAKKQKGGGGGIFMAHHVTIS